MKTRRVNALVRELKHSLVNHQILHTGHPPRRLATRRPAAPAEGAQGVLRKGIFPGVPRTYAQDYSEAEAAPRLLSRTCCASETGRRGGGGGRLLEVGCGEGWMLAAAQRAGLKVSGLNLSEDGLKRFHPELRRAASSATRSRT